MTTAWTRERPTKAGLYWLRRIDGSEHEAGKVVEMSDEDYISGIGSDRSEFAASVIFDDCEWAPAEPPP